MNIKLEESLDLDPLVPPPVMDGLTNQAVVADIEMAMHGASDIYNALSIGEKIDHALSSVGDLKAYDTEMDDISTKALEKFQDLCDMSDTLPDNYVARTYEVASAYLKIALNARESKLTRKLKTLELQLKKAELDKLSGKPGAGVGDKPEFDRNVMLALLKESIPQNPKIDK